jgi:hypothetical protein
MEIFKRQIKFIEDFEVQLHAQLEFAIREFDFVIKDYVINKQLFREGMDGDGEKLPGYKRTTIRLKIIKGDPADRMTLRDTGEFYSHIQIDAFNDRFEITSNVDHDVFILSRLKKQGHPNILKVTDENIIEFLSNYYLPKLKEYVNKQFAK